MSRSRGFLVLHMDTVTKGDFTILKLTKDGYDDETGLPWILKTSLQNYKYVHNTLSNIRCPRQGYVPFRFDNGKLYRSAREEMFKKQNIGLKVSDTNPLYVAIVVKDHSLVAFALLYYARHSPLNNTHAIGYRKRKSIQKEYAFDTTIMLQYMSALKGWGSALLTALVKADIWDSKCYFKMGLLDDADKHDWYEKHGFMKSGLKVKLEPAVIVCKDDNDETEDWLTTASPTEFRSAIKTIKKRRIVHYRIANLA